MIKCNSDDEIKFIKTFKLRYIHNGSFFENFKNPSGFTVNDKTSKICETIVYNLLILVIVTDSQLQKSYCSVLTESIMLN